MFIRDVIRDREPYSLRASASVLEAAEFMAQRKIGAVCVLDEEGKLIGGGFGMPKVEEVANKPADQIEIERGENVMLGTTGRRLGRVEDVLFDHGALKGVVIRPEGFFKRDVVLPMQFIERADDLALFAQLNETDIEQLKPFVDSD